MDNDHTVQAIFQSQEKLTVQTASGGYTTPSAGDYWYDTNTWSVSFTANATGGYRFHHWHKNGADFLGNDANPIQIYMNDDYTLQPQFVTIECLTVQTATGGYTIPAAGDYWYDTNTWSVWFQAYNNSGYVFGYWLKDGANFTGNTANPIQVWMDTDHTLQPQFNAVAPKVHFIIQSSTGGYTDPAAGDYEYDAGDWTLPVTASANYGYRFDHWHLNGGNAGSSNPYPSFQIWSDTTLQPQFVTQEKLTMSSAIGSGTTSPSSPGEYWYDTGDTAVLYPYPSNDWGLYCWWKDGQAQYPFNPYNLPMDTDHAVQAEFREYKHLITETTSGGTTNPAPGTYHKWINSQQPVYAEPAAHYHLEYWTVNGVPSGTDNPITVTMDADKTVKAWYHIDQVYLAMQNNYGLSYSVPSVGVHEYDYGTDVQCWAYPVTNWVFSHWHIDGGDYTTDNPCWVNMYADHALQPQFIPPHTVTVTSWEFFSQTEFSGAEIYKDYTSWGTTPISGSVSHDWHNFDAQDYPTLTFYGWYIEGNWYTDPVDWYVDSAVDMQAWYYYSGKSPPKMPQFAIPPKLQAVPP